MSKGSHIFSLPEKATKKSLPYDVFGFFLQPLISAFAGLVYVRYEWVCATPPKEAAEGVPFRGKVTGEKKKAAWRPAPLLYKVLFFFISTRRATQLTDLFPENRKQKRLDHAPSSDEIIYA